MGDGTKIVSQTPEERARRALIGLDECARGRREGCRECESIVARAIRAAVEEEREACATAVDDTETWDGADAAGRIVSAAKAIRARGQS